MGNEHAGSDERGAAVNAQGEVADSCSTLPDPCSSRLEFDTELDTLTSTELAAALCLDQRCRWDRGHQALAEDYARQLSRVDSDHELLLDVVYNEYLLRQLHGLQPSEEEFVSRFPQLAEELARLFQVHRAIESSGETPVGKNGGTLLVEAEADAVTGLDSKSSTSPFLGGYELLEEIGRGGMGVVYKARQPGTRRVVALKVILAGAFASQREVARFRAEAMAAARLDHPGIVPVYEFGQDGQLFYYSMAYVEGENLASRLSAGRIGPVQAATLIRQIAQAVHYAHMRGITHRDLKPQNILIDKEGQPRIVDFGLAKSEAQEGSLTHTGQLLGTANYVAPEQALGEQHKIGPASDVFAMGAMLYEALTGQPPFAAPTVVAVLSKVVHDQPESPRRLTSSIPRDLETICLKCLAKDPGARYASARSLSDDLERFLESRAILARPPSWWQLAWLWCRRYPAVATLIVAIAALTVLLAIGNQALREERNRALHNERQSHQSQQQALRNLAEAYVNEAQALRRSHHTGHRLESLAAVAKATHVFQDLVAREDELLKLRNEAAASLALQDVALEKTWSFGAKGASATQLAFDANLQRYAAVDADNVLRVRDFATNRVVTRIPGTWPRLRNICLGSDGAHIAATDATSGGDRVLLWRTDGGEARSDSVAGGSKRFSDAALAAPADLGACGAGPSVVDFAPDGKTLAVVEPTGAVRLVDVDSRRQLQRLAYDDFQASGCRFHPTKPLLAAWHGNVVRVISLPGADYVDYVHEHRDVQHLAWNFDQEQFATALSNHNAYIWRLDNPREPTATLRGHQSWVLRAAYRPGSNVLSTSSSDGTTRFWNSATGAELLVADGHCLDFSRDGRLVGGVLRGRTARWQFIDAPECTTLGTPGSYESYVGAVSPCRRWLVTGSWNGALMWDFHRGQTVAEIPGGDVQTIRFSPDGRTIVAGTPEGLWRWKAPDELSAAGHRSTGMNRFGPEEITCPSDISFSDDGRLMAVSRRSGSFLTQRDAAGEDYTFGPLIPVDGLTISPSGAYVAAASSRQNKLEIRRVIGPMGLADRPLVVLPLEEPPTVVRFSPQNRWLLVGTDSQCLLFDCRSWQPVRQFAGGLHSAGQLDFSPDGQLLALGRSEFSIQLIDATTLTTYLLLPSKMPEPWVQFSPDGRRLACQGEDACAKIWDLHLVRQRLADLELDRSASEKGTGAELRGRTF